MGRFRHTTTWCRSTRGHSRAPRRRSNRRTPSIWLSTRQLSDGVTPVLGINPGQIRQAAVAPRRAVPLLNERSKVRTSDQVTASREAERSGDTHPRRHRCSMTVASLGHWRIFPATSAQGAAQEASAIGPEFLDEGGGNHQGVRRCADLDALMRESGHRSDNDVAVRPVGDRHHHVGTSGS